MQDLNAPLAGKPRRQVRSRGRRPKRASQADTLKTDIQGSPQGDSGIGDRLTGHDTAPETDAPGAAADTLWKNLKLLKKFKNFLTHRLLVDLMISTQPIRDASPYVPLTKRTALMKKLLTLTAALAASTLLATPALAQQFSPAPDNGTISGTLILSQTVTLTCSFTADYSVNAAGTLMTITNQSFSGGFGCSALSPLGAWTAVPNQGLPNPTVDITVSAGSLFGSCNGTAVNVAWNNSVGGPNFINTSIPGQVGGTPTPCIINGQLGTSNNVLVQ